MTFFLTLPEVRFFSISENYNHYDTKTSREFDFCVFLGGAEYYRKIMFCFKKTFLCKINDFKSKSL